MSPEDIRRRRLALGYSVEILSEILGVPPKQIERWERGCEQVHDAEALRAALEALCSAHGVEVA